MVTGPSPQPAALAFNHHAQRALEERHEREVQKELRKAQEARNKSRRKAGVGITPEAAAAEEEEDDEEGLTPMPDPDTYTEDGTMCIYSSDSDGHCFFYGPRIDAGRMGGMVGRMAASLVFLGASGSQLAWQNEKLCAAVLTAGYLHGPSNTI